MKVLTDMITERPDVFYVEARMSKRWHDMFPWTVDGYPQKCGEFDTMGDAMEYVRHMDKRDVLEVMVQPQVKALEPFQTHVIRTVWEHGISD